MGIPTTMRPTAGTWNLDTVGWPLVVSSPRSRRVIACVPLPEGSAGDDAAGMEAVANGLLIAEAGAVRNATGRSPQELADDLNCVVSALEAMANRFADDDAAEVIRARAALARVSYIGSGTRTLDGDSAWTPLHDAALEGAGRAINELIRDGADVGARDEDGATPLHCAAEAGHHAAALMLIRAGADVNASDQGGWTALHYAGSRGHPRVVEVLIDAGANVDAEDLDGNSVIDVTCGDESIALLRAAGAVTSVEAHAMASATKSGLGMR